MSETKVLNIFEEVVFSSFSNFISWLVEIIDTYCQTETSFWDTDIKIDDNKFDEIVEAQLLHFFDELFDWPGYRWVVYSINHFMNSNTLKSFSILKNTKIWDISLRLLDSFGRLDSKLLKPRTMHGIVGAMKQDLLRWLHLNNNMMWTNFPLETDYSKDLPQEQIDTIVTSLSKDLHEYILNFTKDELSIVSDEVRKAKISTYETYWILSIDQLLRQAWLLHDRFVDLNNVDEKYYYDFVKWLFLLVLESSKKWSLDEELFKFIVDECKKYLLPIFAEKFALKIIGYYEYAIRWVDISQLGNSE